MSAFDELRKQVEVVEQCFKNMTLAKPDNVSEEKFQEDLYTNVYESYEACLSIEDQLKNVRSALRKKYKVTDRDIRKWIEESEATEDAPAQTDPHVPPPQNSPRDDNLEPPKLVRQNAAEPEVKENTIESKITKAKISQKKMSVRKL